MSLGFSAFDAQQAPTKNDSTRLTLSCVQSFFKASNSEENGELGGLTFYSTPINAVEF